MHALLQPTFSQSQLGQISGQDTSKRKLSSTRDSLAGSYDSAKSHPRLGPPWRTTREPLGSESVRGVSEAPAASCRAQECVKVVIRCRPLSGQEKIDNREKIVDMETRRNKAQAARGVVHPCGAAKVVKDGAVSVRRPGTQDCKNFTFDAVYDEHTIQGDFYEHTGYPIVGTSIAPGYHGFHGDRSPLLRVSARS